VSAHCVARTGTGLSTYVQRSTQGEELRFSASIEFENGLRISGEAHALGKVRITETSKHKRRWTTRPVSLYHGWPAFCVQIWPRACPLSSVDQREKKRFQCHQCYAWSRLEGNVILLTKTVITVLLLHFSGAYYVVERLRSS